VKEPEWTKGTNYRIRFAGKLCVKPPEKSYITIDTTILMGRLKAGNSHNDIGVAGEAVQDQGAVW